MGVNGLYTVTLLGAYIAGWVALFAPCCITFLLPAYLGSVFKEKRRIILMTLIFGAGIFTVMLPAVLGVAVLSRWLFRYHDLTYYSGGIIMVTMGIVTLTGYKLHLPEGIRLWAGKKRGEGLSIFVLGIFSGLASACCAPVLAGVLTLSLISPNFWGSILTGVVFVLGMLTPLLISGLIVDSRKFLTKEVFNKKVGPFILSNVLAAAIFISTGTLAIYLTRAGKISMESSRYQAVILEKTIREIDGKVRSLFSF